MSEQQIPPFVIHEIRAGNAVAVLGAGLGQIPWAEVLEELTVAMDAGQGSEECRQLHQLLLHGRLAIAASYLARNVDSGQMNKVLARVWKEQVVDEGALRTVCGMPFAHVWTTLGGVPDWWSDPPQDDQPWTQLHPVQHGTVGPGDASLRTLFPILGDADSYLVSSAQVKQAFSSQQLHDYLREVCERCTLIFIGFHPDDPDFRSLVDAIATFRGSRRHYFVGSVGPVFAEVLRVEHDIHIVDDGASSSSKKDSNLADFLERLAEECRASDDTDTLRPEAWDIQGWSRLLAQETRVEEARDALRAIDKKAREQEDVALQIELKLRTIEFEPEVGRRVRLLGELAVLYEDAGDLQRAFTTFTAAFKEAPSEAWLREAERLAEPTGLWAELVADVCEVVDDLKQEEQLAARYCLSLGDWYANKLDHDQYAIKSFRQAARLDPNNLLVWAPLTELLRKQQRWAELAEALHSWVDLEPEPSKRVDIYLALGDLYETQLAATTRALDSYNQVLALEEEESAIAALERLYRRLEEWGSLARILEQRAEMVARNEEPLLAVALRKELATVRLDKLNDAEGAMQAYELALDVVPEDMGILRTLQDLYDQADKVDEYLATLERMIAVSPQKERPELLRKLAVESEERSTLYDRAIENYYRWLEVEPSAVEGYQGLARLFRKTNDVSALIDVLNKQAENAEAPDRGVLYAELAQVYELELDNFEKSVECWEKVLQANEDNLQALKNLRRLHESVGAWNKVESLLARIATKSTSDVSLWCEVGEIAVRQTKDLGRAERYFENALAQDETHVPALMGLIEVHEQRQSWLNVFRLLLRVEAQTDNRLERIQLLVRAASLATDKLQDEGQALTVLLKILDLDAEHFASGLSAAKILVAQSQWQQVAPILETLQRTSGSSDDDEWIQYSLARCYEALGRYARAVKCYEKIVQDHPDSVVYAMGLGNVLYHQATQIGEDASPRVWRKTDRVYRRCLKQHRAALSSDEIVDTWFRLGKTALGLNDLDGAEEAFAQSLQRNQFHEPSLQVTADLASAREDWLGVVEIKHKLLVTAVGERRGHILEEVGDLYSSKLQDATSALTSYHEALKECPSSHSLRHKIVELHILQKQWQSAMDMLHALAASDENPQRKAKYQYTAAVIARDELEQPELAMEYFEKSLDVYPAIPKAFAAVEKIITHKQDWAALARAYRKMIKRLGDDASSDQLLLYWSRLGDVCLNYLDDKEGAATAYEVAVSLCPNDMDRHEGLANLYLDIGETRRAEAIDELQVLVQHNPDRVELYRGLSRLYQQEGEADKAYCLAQSLVFLGAANEAEQKLYRQFRPQGLIRARQKLADDLWYASVVHPEESKHMRTTFALLSDVLALSTARSPRAFHLADKERVDLNSNGEPAIDLFRYVSEILGLIPIPYLYLQPKQTAGVRIANTCDQGKLIPSVVFGEPFLNGMDERELVFAIGKRLTHMKPARYLRYALQTVPQLELAYQAIRIACKLPSNTSEDGEKLAKYLEKNVPPSILGQVTEVVRELARESSRELISAWTNATDRTADRVGLILTNDLEVAARMIATEPSDALAMTAKDRLRDLLAYAISDDYFSVRKQLGLSIAYSN